MTEGQGHDISGWNNRLVPTESLQKRSSVTALQGGQEGLSLKRPYHCAL